MVKHGEGLGFEIVKAVINGEIIEPITFQKVRDFCNRNGIQASENHMRVILSNASENTHSPTYKRYFERVGKGEYRILPEYRRQPKYFWLNVDSQGYNWAFSIVKVGSRQAYSNVNSDGSKRKNESCFKSIQIGDFAVAYETGETKAITAICRVIDKYEENDEIIVDIQKTRDFNVFLDLDSMREMKTLNDCQVIRNHRGTLLKLESKHFEIIVQRLEELNALENYHKELNQAVQKSLADGREERKRRLESRTELIPETYETKTRVFKRNPDVIAEVLVRANGICEKCKSPAPFIRASDGTPYLEVHHKIRLADGGEDTVENAIAVCPNCHRELHFG
ncbi:HNH endonuclease [Brevibacillus agri]|uniref:HNH endonuclease n=1 Tax=Brevibacillus TaxID=55080 RepID=UPI001D135A59|nr:MULTISPECIES: HNH endonuclease [Brevibacillus]MED1646024.1 HNH endonuclease [Brevibacillus agri]MED1656337.1 HNH endonuclease [Brevibacillus agri]MED1689259.1 HNH endonuclease [Brevibacillus agri]MED1693782.1 HNH endonuclease [Brevibacillus agri]MED1699122.1 HNH endonuclease [Brevibacillus agri]